jgi:hypothetical protein
MSSPSLVPQDSGPLNGIVRENKKFTVRDDSSNYVGSDVKKFLFRDYSVTIRDRGTHYELEVLRISSGGVGEVKGLNDVNHRRFRGLHHYYRWCL